MIFKLEEIAAQINGNIEGNPNILISKLAKIEDAEEGSISFLANLHYKNFLYTTKASAVIVNNDFIPEQPVNCALIKTHNAYLAFGKLLEIFDGFIKDKKGISINSFIAKSAIIGENLYIGETSFIGEHVKIGNNVKIYPQVYIGDNAEIGDNSVLYPGVKVYHACIIGKSCVIHAGTIIGADGFGFAPQQNKELLKIPQIGNVVIEDNVEIGANTTIDRATLGSTIIRKGVKLDNLIQIAHNVEVGENTLIISQTGVAGSTKIGKNCMIGGQVGIAGHIAIADEVKIAAQSGISSSIKNIGETVMGSPAQEIHAYKRSYIHFKNFNNLAKRINELEQKIKELQNKD